MKKNGFTLIELLVAIFIVMLLITIVSSNLLGARGKARDTVKKEDMRQFVNALRMYYNDYNIYPGISNVFLGCGSDGLMECPALPCEDVEFSAGGTTGCDDSVHYMKKFPKEFNPAAIGGDVTHTMKYYASGDQLEFRLLVELENAGDPAIDASQVRCPDPTDTGTFPDYTVKTYVVCEK